MSLEFKKGRYFSKIWMLFAPGVPVDVFAALFRDLPDGQWRFNYRFRYHVDETAHGSEDRKSGYAGTFDETISESEVLERLEPALEYISVMFGELHGVEPFTIDVVNCQTDEPALIHHLLRQRPWAHIRVEESPS